MKRMKVIISLFKHIPIKNSNKTPNPRSKKENQNKPKTMLVKSLRVKMKNSSKILSKKEVGVKTTKKPNRQIRPIPLKQEKCSKRKKIKKIMNQLVQQMKIKMVKVTMDLDKPVLVREVAILNKFSKISKIRIKREETSKERKREKIITKKVQKINWNQILITKIPMRKYLRKWLHHR